VSLRSAVARSRGVLCETSITHREETAGRRAGVREEGREEGGKEGAREEQEIRAGTSTRGRRRECACLLSIAEVKGRGSKPHPPTDIQPLWCISLYGFPPSPARLQLRYTPTSENSLTFRKWAWTTAGASAPPVRLLSGASPPPEHLLSGASPAPVRL